MNWLELWEQCQAAMGSLGPHYQRQMAQVIRETTGFEGHLPTYFAKGAAPEPFSVRRRHEMTPYASPSAFQELFDRLTAEGYFEVVGEDAYQLTPKGDAGIQTTFSTAQAHIRAVGASLGIEATLQRLAATFRNIVEATLAAPEPRAKWCLYYSRWTDKGLEDSALAQIDQYITDLSRYRDDAHIAAWQDLGVAGQVWETFSYLWQENANNAATLAEKLDFRGYTADDYQTALDELVARGWVTQAEGVYRLTEAGRQVREAAEAETNRYFFVGWEDLSEADLNNLVDDLQLMLEQVKRITAQAAWEKLDDCGYQFFLLINRERRAAIDATGFYGTAWYALYNALGCECLTPSLLQGYTPYAAPIIYEETVKQALEYQGLQPNDDGSFRLTHQGRAAIDNILRATADLFVKAELLSEDELTPLAENLHRLTSAILADDSLPISYMRIRHAADPGDKAHPLVRIDQYNDELNAFRDECHLVAWADTGLTGIEWETLTFIWRGEATNPDALVERLEHRRYGLEDYQAALAQLVERGWIAAAGPDYALTAAGREVREAAEAATDAAFFGHWLEMELDTLSQLYRQIQALHAATLAKVQERTAARCDGLYARLNDAVGKLPPLYRPQLGDVFQDTGLNAPGAFFTLLTGLGSSVQPCKLDVLKARFPYTHPTHWEDGLAHLSSKGYAKPEGEGYVITPEGKAVEDSVNQRFYGALDAINPQVLVDVERMNALLSKVVAHCKESAIANGIHAVYLAERSKHGTPLAQLDYIYDCLNAFRDDAHVYSWREARVTGPAWEAFTLIWRGDAQTMAAVGEQLAFRRISAEAYANHLQELVRRGWLTIDEDGVCTLTEAGKEERELVERLTDRHFYGAWDVLSQAELDELRGLIQAFDAALEALQPLPEASS